jgi:hypothetical protein
MTFRVAALSLIVVACGCKYQYLPQRAAPAQLAPALDPPTSPPPTDHGRVYIDVEDGTATVGRISKIEQKEELRAGANVIMVGTIPVVTPTTVKVDVESRSVDVLCTTPCWIDLPLGKSHLLSITGLRRKQTDIIPLAPKQQPFAYRHALGRHDELDIGKRLPAALVLGLGVGFLVTLPILVVADASAPLLIGWGAVAGAGTVIGSIMIYGTRAVQQDGAGVSYALPPVTATH